VDREDEDTYTSICSHKAHRSCLADYYTVLLNNNDLAKIKCPHCMQDLTTDEKYQSVLKVAGPDQAKKFNSLVRNQKVARSQGKILHCPVSECEGLVHLALQPVSLRQQAVKCDTCAIEVCLKCKMQAHPGVKKCPNQSE